MDTPATLSFAAFLRCADYSLLRFLTADPEQARHAPNKMLRQVKSGHYVEVLPTPLPTPRYVIHSRSFFRELNLSENAAGEDHFMQFFTGNPTAVVGDENVAHVRAGGWASGYALSIYGQEMYNNCPFKNGNGYGDGRAISVLEVLLPDRHGASAVPEHESACAGRYPHPNPLPEGEGTNESLRDFHGKGHRWEFQLKGGGTTPYCRGGDGRAVLRSSIREFLASEAMAAMGVPTSRALCLFVSGSETISRPWYSPGAKTEQPDLMVQEPAAITTRAAPSFLRVGQIELFGWRARKNEHPRALAELEAIFLHTLAREYPDVALRAPDATLADKVLAVAREFGERLSRLTAHWIRVGYCQGNFNSDNCSLGGRTLDYGPFGFMEAYDPMFQMWVGGGEHFAFMNQPMAAVMNFRMFCKALVPLLEQNADAIQALGEIVEALPEIMNREMHGMWAQKMGLAEFGAELFEELHELMADTPVDYTIFWRELSNLPRHVAALCPGFYETLGGYARDSIAMEARWMVWLQKWHAALEQEGRDPVVVSAAMKRVNPKYIPREWMMVEAYRRATDAGDYSLVQSLHDVLEDPYGEQSEEVAALYYKKKDEMFFDLGGTSHCSCSS